jgi:hypothetical protein
MKAATGRTKTRLAADPERGPIITQIFRWRVTGELGIPTIRARLNADPDSYPPPHPERGWTTTGLYEILANPKYTGHQVLGRTHILGPGKKVPVPPEQWIWSAQPTHPALIDKATWDQAQKIGAERGNVQDTEQPRTRPGRRYTYRGRLWCKICKRRMRGVTRTSTTTKKPTAYTYYLCPHDPGHKAHVAAYPDHPNVMISEKTLLAATASFFAQYVFGPDRATMLKAQLPADAEQETARRAAQAKRLDKQFAKNELAQQALISELETPADPDDPAALALRERIRARYRELHSEQKALEAQRDRLDVATTAVSDPALLDALPILGDILTDAPAGLAEDLFDAFHVQAVYSKAHQQITIRATITDTTPDAVTRLLADPRRTPATMREHAFEDTAPASSYSIRDQRVPAKGSMRT